MKFIRNLFSVILSIIFTLILTGGIFICTIHSFTSKENITNVVREIGIQNIEIDFDNDIDSEVSKRFLNLPETQEFMIEIIGRMTDYAFHGNEMPDITENDIIDIINSDALTDILDTSLTEDEEVILRDQLRKNLLTINEEFRETARELKEELNEEPLLGTILSPDIMTTIIAILSAVAILIIISRWSPYRWLVWIVVPMIIAGSLNILLNLLVIPTIRTEETFTNDIISNITNMWITNSIIIVVIGIVLIISYLILNKTIFKTEEEKLIDNF